MIKTTLKEVWHVIKTALKEAWHEAEEKPTDTVSLWIMRIEFILCLPIIMVATLIDVIIHMIILTIIK